MSKLNRTEPTDLAPSQQPVDNSQALNQSDPKYRPLLQAINTGFARCQAIRDQSGKIIDYRFLELNPAFEKLTGVDPQRAVGKGARQVFPALEPDWFDAYQPLMNTGQTSRLERFVPGLDRWVELTAIPYGNDQFVAHYDDITTRRQAQEAQRQSEARLQLALDIAQLGTWSWNLLTNEGYLDDRGAQLIGMAPGYQPNVAQAQRTSIHPDDLARTETDVMAGIAQGVPFGLQYRVIHPDQSIHHIRSRFQVVADPTGRPVELMGTNLDVTAEYELTTALRQSQEKQAFLLALNDALHAVAKPIDIEATAGRLLGEHLGDCQVQFGEMIGEGGITHQSSGRHQPPGMDRFRPVLPGLKPLVFHRAAQVQLVADVATDPGHTRAERAELLAAQIGAYITVPVVKQAQWIATLTVHSIRARAWTRSEVELVQETAERTWAIRERARTQTALDEANRRKDEFLAMLAHELRNPMATIRSGLQLLMIEENDPTSRPPGGSTTITMMNRQTDHLVRLVDDLLDVSRISQGKIALKRERLDLGSLVRAAVEAIRPQFETSQKSLRFPAATAAFFVDGDAARLTQVVTNLLTNGLRYTDTHGQVWVRLGQQQGEALLEVTDNGIGLSEDQLEAIFELFVQADHSLARSLGGLGIGLTLAKRLVELHGGQVAARSAGLGQGSTFTVCLPLVEAPEDERPAVTLARPITPPRVLVIDDNADAALTLSMLLRRKGYEVHSRLSGGEGILAAESLRPAIIVCDIGMPEVDGYDTCRRIRAQSWGRSLALIALTGYGQAQDKQRAEEAGFDAHLLKPVDVGELVALLTKFLPGS